MPQAMKAAMQAPVASEVAAATPEHGSPLVQGVFAGGYVQLTMLLLCGFILYLSLC